MDKRLSTLAVLVLLTGCVSENGDAGFGPNPGVSPITTGTAQPRNASYRCESGSRMTIENRGASVMLTVDDDEPLELPASPPGSTNRYGKTPYALLIEGGEVLWMKSGDTPDTCVR